MAMAMTVAIVGQARNPTFPISYIFFISSNRVLTDHESSVAKTITNQASSRKLIYVRVVRTEIACVNPMFKREGDVLTEVHTTRK